jgi:tetratricopeptide (TPR) repeat protein
LSEIKYWIVAPWFGDDKLQTFQQVWNYDKENHTFAVGWNKMGNVSNLSRDQMITRAKKNYPRYKERSRLSIVNSLWKFYREIQVGDIVIARWGRKDIVGIGRVTKKAYYDPQKGSARTPQDDSYVFRNFIDVHWFPVMVKFDKVTLPMMTLVEYVSNDIFNLLGKSRNATEAEMWYSVGTAMEMAGAHDDALEALQTSVDIDPQPVDTWYGLFDILTMILYAVGKITGVSKTRDEYRQYLKGLAESFIEVFPDDSYGWYTLGLALHDSDKRLARNAYTSGISKNPDDPLCRFGLGSLMLFDNDFHSAKEHLEIATRIDSNNYFYWDALSIYFEKLEQWEKVSEIQDEIRSRKLSTFDIPHRIQSPQKESKSIEENPQYSSGLRLPFEGSFDFHNETQSMYTIEEKQVTRTPREAILVNSFMWWLTHLGIEAKKEVHYIDVTFSYNNESYAVEAKFFHESAINQIRSAVGQLLHYNHYPNRDTYTHWVILLNREPKEEDRLWISKLREKYDLPLYVGWKSGKEFEFDDMLLN